MHSTLQRAILVAVFALFAAVLVWGLTLSSNRTPASRTEVKLEKRPERIVSLSPANTELLFAVGAGPRVVAGTSFDTYPEEAKVLPKIGGFSPNTISIEAILALKPDVVFAAGKFQQSVIDELTKRNIPVVSLEPGTIDDVLNDIQSVGRLTGTSEQAEVLVADFRKRRDAVRKRVEAIPLEARPKTVYILNEEPLMAIGSGSFVAELLKESGAKNIFADIQQQYPRVGDEDILSRGADIVICPNHADGGLSKSLAKRPGWEKLNAVKSGKVIAIDPDLLTRPGPRLIDGLEALEKALAGR